MAKDSTSAQLYEAVGRKRVAASILEYFIAHYDKLRRVNTDCPADDPALWLHFNQQYLADKFHVSTQTIARHIKLLCRLKFISLYQSRGYDRSYSYIINREKVSTVYQLLPICEMAEESCQPIKMIGSNLSECQDATYQNDSFHAIKMSGCSLSNYPKNYSSSSTKGIDDAEAENNPRKKAETKLQPVQSHERQSTTTPYDAEKETVIQQFRECNIVPEHAEADIAKFGIHLCKAVVSAVQLKKRKGEKVQGQGAGLIKLGLKQPASLGLEMTKQGEWLPAHLIAKQLRLKATHAAATVTRKLVAWDALDYASQCRIRDSIDAAYPDKPQAVRFQLYRKAAEHGLDTSIAPDTTHTETDKTYQQTTALGTYQVSAYEETQETAVHEANSVSAQVSVHR